MTVEVLSRLQFALTAMFHVIFPALTVGLSIFLAITYFVYWRTHKPVYLQMFRFWRKIFAVGFAIGVVAGAVLTFELGLNWGQYGAKTGPIVGPIIGMEVVTAFFVEAGFIGIMLYGEGRVKKGLVFTACVMVAIGTLLSTTWIMAANSWMQDPQGYAIQNGQFVPQNWSTVIFTTAFGWRFPHMLIGVLISSGLFIAGLSAYYLIKKRATPFARRSFSYGIIVVALLIPFQLWIGDGVAGNFVAKSQLTKLEAWEGNWESTNNGYVFFAIPDQKDQRNLAEVSVPCLGSIIGAKDLTCKATTPGLKLTPTKDQPSMAWTFWAFRLMFYSSIFIFFIGLIGVWLKLRGRLETSRPFHYFALWSMPLGILAIIGGWVTAEMGRQPFVVYGLLRTKDAVSNLASSQLILSVFGFIAIYALLLTVYIIYIVKTAKKGPEMDDPKVTPEIGKVVAAEPLHLRKEGVK